VTTKLHSQFICLPHVLVDPDQGAVTENLSGGAMLPPSFVLQSASGDVGLQRPTSLSSWIMAARPRTLALSVTPVALAVALAWATHHQIHEAPALAALLGSALIQIGTNLHNDAVDSERGGDGTDRIGPPRATASGLLRANTVKHAALGCYAAAASFGVYLIAVGGWPIFVLGALSITSGWAYTGGPRPIAYTPFGELFVVLFFGLGAVCGTYWLCTLRLDTASLASGLALGLLTAAVLLVNNHRDVEADARVGRRTLAIIAGPALTSWTFAALMLAPFALLLPISLALPKTHVWLALGAFPAAAALIYHFRHERHRPSFNRILVQTVRTEVLFSVLLGVGAVL
jgi:1,4-dihydroxy-2-naphthoate polyprenyltransferase